MDNTIRMWDSDAYLMSLCDRRVLAWPLQVRDQKADLTAVLFLSQGHAGVHQVPQGRNVFQ